MVSALPTPRSHSPHHPPANLTYRRTHRPISPAVTSTGQSLRGGSRERVAVAGPVPAGDYVERGGGERWLHQSDALRGHLHGGLRRAGGCLLRDLRHQARVLPRRQLHRRTREHHRAQV
eukprot:3600283-Pyramimonas_sp.AAC.1